MATIRKRNGQYQVQVRQAGHTPRSRTFSLKKDAEAWAREIERAQDRDEFLPDRKSASVTLASLLERYALEVTPTKRSASTEKHRINLILRQPLSKKLVSSLSPADVATFRDERLKIRATETVRQDLVLIRQVLETARREWGLHLGRNPVDEVRKPPSSRPRSRRLVNDEADALAAACKTESQSRLFEIVMFARCTGMRRGEILRIEWSNIDWDNATLFIPKTKNDEPRHVPLAPAALTLLHKFSIEERERPFPISSNAVRLAWRRLVKRANIVDLRFHDLRHEAISAFFELGLSTPEVQLISGHKDVRQLMRYTHMRAADVSRKLRRDQIGADKK